MSRRSLNRRVDILRAATDPPIAPQFHAFAAEVIRFGGHEPTPDAVEQLARWYAGGYRRQLFPA